MASKQLSLLDATLLVMGGIIGVGIFFTPRTVAAAVPDPSIFLLMWVIGGVIALCGAQTFAELGATFPHAGGWYVFLREMFGPFLAFLFAWIVLFVISTGAIAVMMSFLVDTLRALVPEIGGVGSPVSLAIGASILVLVTGLSMRGVKAGATLQNACMLLKLAAILVMVAAGFALASPAETVAADVPHVPELSGGMNVARGMIAAVLPVLFAFGGWQMVCYVAPEVKDPTRTLPRAILLGIFGVVVVYLSINAAYLRVLGIDRLVSDPGFAATMATRTLGSSGGRVLQVAMVISALGVCVVTIIATPWLYVAMAREGLFFKRFAEVSPTTGAPVLALSVQAVLCLAYWFWGQIGARTQSQVTPDVLANSVVFVEWIFHALVAIGLLRLRAMRPDLPRPYKSPLYPLAPVCYALFALAVVIGNLVNANVRDTMIGLSLLLAGALIYHPWRRLVRG